MSSGTIAGTNDHWPGHRRQLGERLFPKVNALRPVCSDNGTCLIMMIYMPIYTLYTM